MKMTKIAALVAAAAIATPVVAQDLHFPMLNYRTGPFAPGGIPFADGYQDYLTLINERDGGIGGNHQVHIGDGRRRVGEIPQG